MDREKLGRLDWLRFDIALHSGVEINKINPILSHLTFYVIFKFSLMFFYSYISSFLPQKIKFANLPFLTILEKWTFTTIFLENLKCRKPVNFIPIFKKNS